MASNIAATYKRFNGTDWDTVYFATSAAQVGESSTRFFIKSSNTVNSKAFTQNGGITLYAGDIAMSSTDATTIAAAIKDAKDSIPSGVLTTSNYATTLGSVYQAKDADLTSIAGLTGTSGILKKTAANTWSLDTTTYAANSDLTSHTGNTSNPHSVTASQVGLGNVTNVATESTITQNSTKNITSGAVYTALAGKVPTSRTVNGKALSGNITLYAGDIAISNSDSTTIAGAIDNVAAIANGRTKTYVLYYNTASVQIYNKTVTTSTMGFYNSSNQKITNLAVDTLSIDHIICFDPNDYSKTITISGADFKVGDVILVAEINVPDFYVSSRYSPSTGSYVINLNKLESTKVDISGKADKATTLAGYGITDAKIADGVITLGSNTITPLTSHQSLANYVTKSGTEALTNKTYNGYTLAAACAKSVVTTVDTSASLPTSNAVKTFVEGKGYTTNTGTITEIKIGGVSKGTSGSVDLPAYPTSLPASNTTSTYASNGTAPVNGTAVASALSARATKIFYSADAPSAGSAITGDIWIDI